MPDDDDTHALPFQYWPEGESVVDVGVQLEPFQCGPDGHEVVVECAHALPSQYCPEVHDGGEVTHVPAPWRYCRKGHPPPPADWLDPLQPEIGALAQLLIWVVLGIT